MIVSKSISLSDSLNSLPNEKSLDWSKIKAFADDMMNITQMMISVFDRVQNIVGKGENVGIPTMFSKGFPLKVIESQDCVLKS